MKFTDFPLTDEVVDSIASIGYEEATPIQEQAIPIVLDNKDLIACAQTGTGKTGAYLIPVINKLMQKESNHSRVLIIAPTRELAAQIDQNIDALSYFTGISSVSIVGGKDSKDFDRQKYGIVNGADILVCTPGRFISHMALGYMDLSHIEVVILDEADKMLDMGFYGDILRITGGVPKERQTLLFSATMPANIRKLAKKIMSDPEEISLNLAKPAEGINQMVFLVYDEQKIPLLEHLLKERDVESMIVFASSKVSVDQIERNLKKLKYNVRAMHSDRSQEERTETLRAFKNKQFRIIVGTDVLARGIDIDNLSHVVNFDAPLDAEDYVHRVGRTARASATGEAITFVNPKDMRRLRDIERLIEQDIPKPPVPEELGETPEYRPGRSGGGDRRRGKGRSSGSSRGRGGDRRGSGRSRGGDRNRKQGNRNRNRRRSDANQKGPKSEGQVNGEQPKAQEGSDAPKKRKKRRNRKRPQRKND